MIHEFEKVPLFFIDKDHFKKISLATFSVLAHDKFKLCSLLQSRITSKINKQDLWDDAVKKTVLSILFTNKELAEKHNWVVEL